MGLRPRGVQTRSLRPSRGANGETDSHRCRGATRAPRGFHVRPRGFHGRLIGPDDAGYDDARRVYNGMIDKRPSLIARCADVDDVVTAVTFARTTEGPVAVRGGGHNGGGLGIVDDGLVIDLGALDSVRVDPAARTARVGGGALWSQVDRATGEFGLATPAGTIASTGVAGLTLGGGIGHLTRHYGLTIDNLVSADMVLADGSRVTADETHEPELFWAIRGGGGNFGIVTSFVFRLHPVSTVLAGPTLYPTEMAADVLRFWNRLIEEAPPELNSFFAWLTVPPGPPFPEELHLKKMCALVTCYSGDEKRAEEVLRPIRTFGPPVLDGIAPVPFPAWQSAFDPVYPAGDQWYWRADFIDDLGDDAIERHVEHGPRLPTWKSTSHIYPINGAAAGPSNDATPWAYRRSKYAQVIAGVDPDPANAGRIRDWAVDYWEAVHPYSAGGAYVNFMMEEGQERVRATYRDNYARLARIKARYDPDNLFHVNQNIRPA
jgi:FAD/FMN-containing dehydrogenase